MLDSVAVSRSALSTPEPSEFCVQTVPLLAGREARPLMGWRARPAGRELNPLG